MPASTHPDAAALRNLQDRAEAIAADIRAIAASVLARGVPTVLRAAGHYEDADATYTSELAAAASAMDAAAALARWAAEGHAADLALCDVYEADLAEEAAEPAPMKEAA